MKEFAYLLTDETKPAELWEIVSRSEFGPVTLKNCLNPCIRVLVNPEEIWVIAAY